jgi:hypothetical protein
VDGRLTTCMSYVVVSPSKCTILESGETAVIHDRALKPWYLKVLPIWWFLNDDEQHIEQAPWYQPDKPEWLRWVMWNMRNPAQNLRAYCGLWALSVVLLATAACAWFSLASWWLLLISLAFVGGVSDRNYMVYGRAPVMTVQRNDLVPPQHGFQWCVIALKCGLFLPFLSYSGKHVVWYWGWQPSGFFGVKFNLHSE